MTDQQRSTLVKQTHESPIDKMIAIDHLLYVELENGIFFCLDAAGNKIDSMIGDYESLMDYLHG